jgi:hypothetical protein
MGTIKRLKNPDRVLVSIGCDELIGEKFLVAHGENLTVGSLLWFIATTKLNTKKIKPPTGAVKIRFDQPTGKYQILLMEPGDLGD